MRNAELYLKGAAPASSTPSTAENIRASFQFITRRVSDDTKLLKFTSLRWTEIASKTSVTAFSTSRNTGTSIHGTCIPEHPKTRNTPSPPKTTTIPCKTRNTSQNSKNSAKSLKQERANMLPLKNWNVYHACVSFSKLHPLIAQKIIWFHIHSIENIYKRHSVTIFLPASRSLSSLAGITEHQV